MGTILWTQEGRSRPISHAYGIKRVSSVRGTHLAVYAGDGWRSRFWDGVNLGATLPGHAPGDLAPTKKDYLRWFGMMKAMHVDVVRVYTILPPRFYEALAQFDSGRKDPLWLIQGVWTPEKRLIGKDRKGTDAYAPEITHSFREEIKNAVRVVHGDADLPPRPGHASGRYRTDVSEYLLGWMVGTEWYPYAVKVTDAAHPHLTPYSGRYFRATKNATPFESWLASMLETLANTEMHYGWQHPVAITNWLTTDPLHHPDEAFPQEDMVSVDPTHIKPTSRWKAGYYAAFHVYPYYPDFMRYERKYQRYVTPDGRRDPYAGYLNELRHYVKGMPLVVAEFGVPSSRGMAHRGPLGRNQGYHTEKEQGEIDKSMLEDIRQQGYDGALVFSWQDEWFKYTWNTRALDIPANRRSKWLNPLTNEQNFGVINEAAGKAGAQIYLDGKTSDWKNHAEKTKSYPGFTLSVTHDPAYVYLLLKKKHGEWDLSRHPVTIGFGNQPGGSEKADVAPGLRFPGGIQTLLQLRSGKDSRMMIDSAYDYFTWYYGSRQHAIPEVRDGGNARAGRFLLWKLALSYPLTLPQSGRKIPFEAFDVGRMTPGITDPDNPGYDSLADWYAKGAVIEVRIPWMMLGYTDPSRLMVWENFYQAGKVRTTRSTGLRIYPATEPGKKISPLRYTWSPWNQPPYHERKKQSYYILQKAFETNKTLLPIPPPQHGS